MLHKHVSRFGSQWDRYLSGILWTYRNTPHDSTREKPSFLLFRVDCRSRTEAEITPPSNWNPTNVVDYREELMLSLSSARQLANETIQKAQRKYKAQFDSKALPDKFRVGEWVLIRFPHEESGSYPGHGMAHVESLL